MELEKWCVFYVDPGGIITEDEVVEAKGADPETVTVRLELREDIMRRMIDEYTEHEATTVEG